MTKEDKELLLNDLCSRLPHGVKIELTWWVMGEGTYINTTLEPDHIEQLLNDEDGDTEIKPYLRPMSSMTEKEYEQYRKFSYYGAAGYRSNNYKEMVATPSFEKMDFLNAHHFDYRGLIEKGLAIEVTEKNNLYK